MVHLKLIFKLKLSKQESIEFITNVNYLVNKLIYKQTKKNIFFKYSGNYHISLTYNGSHIDDSPYHLSLHTHSSQEQVVPPPNIPIRAIIEPMEFYVEFFIFVF
jgi:hypothetical protein